MSSETHVLAHAYPPFQMHASSEPTDASAFVHESAPHEPDSPPVAFAASFFLFGTINNILYVVILSAALDLIGNGPKGIILLANIAPALAVKIGWPYLVRVRLLVRSFPRLH